MTRADHSKYYARTLQDPASAPPAAKIEQQVANETLMQPITLPATGATGQLQSSSSIQAEFEAVHHMCQP